MDNKRIDTMIENGVIKHSRPCGTFWFSKDGKSVEVNGIYMMLEGKIPYRIEGAYCVPIKQFRAGDTYKLVQLLRSDRRFLRVRIPPRAPVEGEAELAASLNARTIRTLLTLFCVVGV